MGQKIRRKGQDFSDTSVIIAVAKTSKLSLLKKIYGTAGVLLAAFVTVR